MNKKYELTDVTMKWDGYTLHRIRALKSFSNVKEGELGGWVESESNLDPDGNCWVYDNAKVYSNARIFHNAKVYSNARIFGDAQLYENAEIHSDIRVIRVYGHAKVHGNAYISGNASVFGNARVCGRARVCGNAIIYEHAQIRGRAFVCDDVIVSGNADIFDGSIHSYAKISKDAKISSTNDYFVIGPIGSRDGFTTFYKTTNGDIMVSCGCFNDLPEKFEAQVKKTHKGNRHERVYLQAIKMAMVYFDK